MKKYMLFTREDLSEKFSTFQGDFDSLGLAYRKVGCMVQNTGKLYFYKIVTFIRLGGNTVSRCVAEGFINGDDRLTDLYNKKNHQTVKEELKVLY